MSARVPNQVDPFRLAAHTERVEGRISLARASRLAGAVARAPAEAELALRFFRDESGTTRVEGQVRAELELECQRCLEPFDAMIETQVDLALVESAAEEGRLLESGRESMVIADGRLDLLELVEDELLLGLPLIPMHPSADECSPAARDLLSREEHGEPREEKRGASPFAVLADLKTKE